MHDCRPASARALAVPEILDLTFSFLAASDLPALADNVTVSRVWRSSIVRRLQQSELDLYRIAASACRYRRLELLVSTCRAVSHLPYQSPRVDLNWEEISLFSRGAAWWYGFSSDNATVQEIDLSYAPSSLLSRRYGEIYKNPEWYLEKTFGRHRIPAPGGFRSRFGAATMFLISQYASFFPQPHAFALIKDFFQDLLRVDNATSIKALCDSYPCLANMSFMHQSDTLLTMACCNYACPWSSVEMLLEKGANACLVTEDPQQLWPLEWALKLRFPTSTIRALVKHGARARWSVIKDLCRDSEQALASDIFECVETATLEDKSEILADKDGSDFVRSTQWRLSGCPPLSNKQLVPKGFGLKRASSWIRTKSNKLYETFHR